MFRAARNQYFQYIPYNMMKVKIRLSKKNSKWRPKVKMASNEHSFTEKFTEMRPIRKLANYFDAKYLVKWILDGIFAAKMANNEFL
jgi:hypothetical protein